MEAIERAVEVLNGLIEVNNDRLAGFAQAAKELKFEDNDLKILFETLRDDSRQYVHELGREVYANGGEAEMELSSAATMHSVWNDIKSTFTSVSRKAVLEECERGEEELKAVYENVLASENELPSEIMEIVYRQKEEIEEAYQRIKLYKDQEAA